MALLVLAASSPAAASVAASVGVGVGTGKINLDKPVAPGLTYALPAITVFNTGDAASSYEMAVTYNERQSEAKPHQRWFSFKPKTFRLDPRQSKVVAIQLKPATWSAKPGRYFAYLEAHPVVKGTGGTSTVKVAAATKLNFEVKPANLAQRLYYALLAFWIQYRAALLILVLLIGLVWLVRTFRRYLKRRVLKEAAKLVEQRGDGQGVSTEELISLLDKYHGKLPVKRHRKPAARVAKKARGRGRKSAKSAKRSRRS